jgi:hypothetical protein
MKEETTRNKNIQQKPIFYNQEPLHAPLKAQGGLNMPIVFFKIKKYYLNVKLCNYPQSNLQLTKKKRG